MSVRYTATWYEVMQAQQHHTHQRRIYSLPAGPVRQIAVVCGGQQAGFLAVPARPAGPLSSHTDTHSALTLHAVSQ